MTDFLGETILHKMNGTGTVISHNKVDGALMIRFNSGITFPIKYPESFYDGIITFENPELQNGIAERYQRNKTRLVLPKTQPNENAKNTSKKPKVFSRSEAVNNPYSWDEQQEKICENCKKYKKETCAGLKSAKLCRDFDPIPHIRMAEKYLWPKK